MSRSGDLAPSARAIVVHDDKILVMKRVKKGRKYMVTPGGRVEPGEKLEEALIRELAEETTIEVADPRLVFVENPNDNAWGIQYIYLCRYVSGEPQLHPDSEEVRIQNEGGGVYEPVWWPIDSFPDSEYPFLSQKLGEEIAVALKESFPEEPKKWTLQSL